MKRSIDLAYGDRRVLVEVGQSDRRTMQVAVHPDGRVVVTAPVGTSLEDVERRVARRARWIASQLAYFEQFMPRTPPRRFVSGETHLYLGRQYRLRVGRSDRETVRLIGGRLEVTVVAEETASRVEQLLTAWYTSRAETYFAERLDACWARFASSVEGECPQLRLRRMKTQWGSMSARGVLTLNTDLIRSPRECIDYVIVHELCHLKNANHGHEFAACLELALPDWQRRKHRLELTLV